MKVDRKVKAEKRPPKAKTVKGNGQAAPKVSGKQLLAAYEHIPVGIVEASLDGKYMDVNAEFCRILGYSRRELLRRGIKDYTHEDDYGIDFKLYQDLIAGKIPFYRLEKRFVRKGGGIIWTELTRSLVCDEKGKPLYTTGVVLDISDRKDVESVLRDSLEQLRLATGAAQMFMWEWDFQNRSYTIADNFEKVLGFSAGLLPKNDFETVWALCPEEDIQRIAEEYQRAIEQQRDLRVVPCRVINPETNQIVWLEVSAKIVYDGEGNPKRMFGVAQNITESKEAEATVHLARNQAERSAERTARLQEVTAALSEALTPAQVAEVLTTHGARAFGAMHSTMMLLSEDGQTLEILYSTVEESLIRPYKHFPVSLQVPAADVVRSGQPVWMESRQQYLECYPHLAEQIHRWGQQAAVAVPMIYEERILGVLTFSLDRVLADNQEDRDYALTLARQGAQALDRSRAENALRESEERFRAIVSQATAGIAESDLDSRLVFVNPGFCAMLGYSEEELLGKTIWELTYTDDLEENKRLFKRMLERGEAYQFEKRFIRKDGSLLWASVSVTAIHDLAGNPKGGVGVVLDIEQRKQAELGLAEYARQQEALYQLSDRLHRTSSLEEIYKAGLDAILDALQCNRASILLFDEQGVMRFVAWLRLSDAYCKAVEGHSPWKWDAKDPQPISIDDVRTAELDESLRRVIQAEGIGSLAFIPLVSDGTLIGKFMVYFDMPHVFDEWDIDLSLTIARQLVFGIDRLRADEELRQSEERFRTMANTMPSIVWTAAPNGRITYANDQWFRYAGITPQANATGWPEMVLHPDDYERCVRAWTHALETVPDEYLIEVRNRRYDGQYRWFQTRAVPVRDDSGKAKAWYGVTTDIHERIETENRLALLAAISDMLRNVDDPYDLMYRISEAVGQHLHVKRALFNEIDLEHDQEIVYRDYHNGIDSVAGVHKVSEYSSVTSAEVAAGRTVVNRDSKSDPRTALDYERTYAVSGERAYVAVPLMRDNRWVASLWVSDDEPRQWTNEEVSFLETVAERTWAIVEKLRINTALRESEQRFRGIFETAGVSVWVEDFSEVKRALEELRRQGVQDLRAYFRENPDFVQRAIRMVRILDVNNETLDLFGARSKEDLLQSLDKIFLPETEPAFIEELIALAEGDEVARMETTEQTLDGRRISVIFTIHFGPPSSDQSRVVVTLTDITERKEAEEALRASEERMRLATDAAGMFAWEFDIQNQSFTLSDNVAEVLGFSADLISESLEDMQSFHRPEELLIKTVQRFSTAEDTAMIWEAMARAFEQQTDLRDLQYRLVNPENGQVTWVEVNARTIYDKDGRPERMYGVSQNITERKRIEEALRIENERFMRFVDSNIVGILIGDASGNVIIANDYYLNLLGVTRQDFEQGRVDWKRLTPSEWLPADDKAIQELRERGICEPYEKEYVRADGSRVPVYIADALLPGPREEIAAFVLDITERKRAEEQLRRSAEFDSFSIALTDTLRLLDKPGEILSEALRMLGEKLQVDRVLYSEIEQDDETILFLDDYVKPGVPKLIGRASLNDYGKARGWLRAGENLIINDATTSPNMDEKARAAFAALGIRAGLGIPLIKNGRWIAILGVHHGSTRLWTENEIKFVKETAERTWSALEHARAQEALRESEERYRFIVENTSDGIWSVELEEPMPISLPEDEQIDWYFKHAVIRQCNLGMARMYGYDSIEEVIGLPMRVIMPRENPMNLELSRQFIRSHYRLVDAESREIGKDGRELVFLNNMVGIVENGKLVGEWGTNRDITARKRAEEALRASESLYRTIARSIPGGGVYVIDKDFRYLVAEGPVTEAFGLSRQMLEGHTVPEVFPSAAGEQMLERLKQNFAGETVSFETAHNGRFYWTQQAPLLDSIGHAIVVTLDITERKKAEEALRQSEERFARFMQHLPGLAWIKDMEGRYVYANAAAEKAFNTAPERLYGSTDEEIFPLETAALFKQNDQRALMEPEGVQAIETLTHTDGVLHYSLVSKFAIPGPEGSPTLIGGTAFDITERMVAEEALRESEERFRAILRQATAGIVRKDVEGRLVYVNEAFCNMLGYTGSDLLGKTVWDFMHSDDIAENRRSYQRLMREGIPFKLERRFLREDGSVIWVDASVSPILDASGKPQSAVAVEVDVTGRKQAEDALRELNLQLEERVLGRTAKLRAVNQTLREEITERRHVEEALRRSEAAARANEETLSTLFDLLPVGISFLDPDGQIIRMNSALENILKLSKEQITSKAYHSRTYIRANGTLMPPAEFASARALAGGKTVYGVETGIVLEDGEVIWTSVSAAPVAVANVGAVVVTVDITENKRAERALQESRGRLQILSQRLVEVQEEERRAIARELHDRVGQTLAALNINLLIVNGQLTDKVDEAIRTRMQDSMKLVAETIALVRDVMSNLRPSVLDDYGLEAALQSHLEQYMSRYEIKVVFDKPRPSLPRLGPSVEMTLLRIAQEAMMNIAKHAQASEVRLSLRQEPDAIHMTIQDNGAGIQSWEMANRPGSHGMTIMRERAEAIGGNLKVSSVPGQGTTVDVSIPRESREGAREQKESQ